MIYANFSFKLDQLWWGKLFISY